MDHQKGSSLVLADLPDESLALLAQQKNAEASALLVSRYLRLINRYAFQYRNGLDFDDLAQEGCIGLLDAIKGFSPERNSAFGAFASVCIRNRISKYFESQNSKKNLVLSESCSLDDISERADGLTPEQIVIGKESFQAVISDINAVLSALEKKVLFFHLGGMDYKAIAEALDISEKSVDNALQRVRKKLKSIHRA